MSLIEVMVVIALGLVLMGMAVIGLTEVLSLQQRRAAKDLALNYELLHDEAMLRNMTFRVAYHLDGGYYEIEAGDANTLVFSDPDDREDWEEDRERKLRRFTDREIEEGAADHLKETSFAKVTTKFQTKWELPRGTRFGGVYTPQYGDWVEPEFSEEDPDKPLIVHSYIFANGSTEHTVVHIVDEDDDEVGFTIAIEPLSGKVHLIPELVDWEDTIGDAPQQGPELAL